MRVVITGGGGFIGSRLARALLARGKLTAPDGSEREISRIVLLDARVSGRRCRAIRGSRS